MAFPWEALSSLKGRLQGKAALVTGGSRGIGRAISLAFAKEGTDVCVNYSKSKREANAVVDSIKALGRRAIAVKANVAELSEVKAMVRRTLRAFKKIDILVNNAGIIYRGDVLSLDDDKVDEMFDVNVKGIMNSTKEVARGMIEKKSGKIVNIASVAAFGTSAGGTTHYSVTKAAVVTLTKRLALELGPHGINVNCIAPGFIQTDQNMAGRTPEEYAKVSKDFSQRAMLGRIGQPEEIAALAVFLSSDESSFITAQTITADGGRLDMLSRSA